MLPFLTALFVVDIFTKLTPETACFGARGKSFGKVYINRTCSFSHVKLVHRSGFVRCASDSYRNSNFGCLSRPPQKADITVILTDSADTMIYPDTPPGNTDFAYHLEGYTCMSPEIVLELKKPFKVNAGETLRIWYGEDLSGSNSSSDNSGTSCVDVYAWPA